MTDVETQVLNAVKEITYIPATFFNGTLFLDTQDSKIATDVFFHLTDKITAAIAYGKFGTNETSYDFLATR